jgi:hypothetical protein
MHMELAKIEQLIEKYFDGETTLAEENELKKYFSSAAVAPHLEHYTSLFQYFVKEKEVQFSPSLTLKKKNNKQIIGLGLAASMVFFAGLLAVLYFNNNDQKESIPTADLGQFESPEEAFEETQKALALLSTEINVGTKSVAYINEYENAKKLIFKK